MSGEGSYARRRRKRSGYVEERRGEGSWQVRDLVEKTRASSAEVYCYVATRFQGDTDMRTLAGALPKHAGHADCAQIGFSSAISGSAKSLHCLEKSSGDDTNETGNSGGEATERLSSAGGGAAGGSGGS